NLRPKKHSFQSQQESSKAETGQSKPDKGKCIATGTEDPPVKLKKASKEVRRDPNEAALIDFQLHDGRVVKMTHEEIYQYLEKAKKVKIIELSKPEIGKVIAVEVKAVENNDIRDIKPHKEFTFGNFGINEWE
ncbi:hypothetical protein Tco_0061460, partial [Tanacetum coccineum]